MYYFNVVLPKCVTNFLSRSLFLTISTIMAISFSLAIAYFTYVFIARVKFFPFMNILATVIAVGKMDILIGFNFYISFY